MVADAEAPESSTRVALTGRRKRRRLRVLIGAALIGLLVLGWWLKPFPAAGPRAAVLPIYLEQTGARAEGAVVYANGFDSAPGSSFAGWSSSTIRYANRFGLALSGNREPQVMTNVESPKGQRRFLGEFGGPRLDPTARTRVRQSIRLGLNDLAPHARVTVSFDLLILKSWDGNSPQYGPDRWSLSVDGGPTLLDTTFSNNPKVATEGSTQDFPRPGSRPQEGASARRTLGYTFFGDSVYHLSFTFPHSGSTLGLAFASDLFEGKGLDDESWGLDNVTVRLGGDGNEKAPEH